ncbi:MAG: response regulator [Planctomycetota bacterium]|nr:MAG: response regulator [Planctomycetota bacterium]
MGESRVSHDILLVDDDHELRSACTKALSAAGADVCEAADGQEALRTLHMLPFDLVITEIFVPKVTGLQLLLELRRSFPGVASIATSWISNREYLADAKGLGADRVICKPFEPDELVHAVREIYETRARRRTLASRARTGSVLAPRR